MQHIPDPGRRPLWLEQREGRREGTSSEGEMAEASWPVQGVGKKKGCQLEGGGRARSWELVKECSVRGDGGLDGSQYRNSEKWSHYG